ncbi:MAG: hypothetical protein ACTFAK_12430 [Candidatus Electronema sp. VV]
MTAPLRRAALFLLLVCAPALASEAPEQPAAQAKTPSKQAIKIRPKAARQTKTQPVLVVLPEDALFQTLSGLLPLPIEHDASEQFKGEITVDSISSLTVDNGRIIVSGQLSGRNMSMNANVGGQSIQVRLGSLVLPVICETALRFDEARQLLFVTPRFQRAGQGGGDADEALLALLNSLSKEYAVPLRNLTPLSGQIGSRTVQLRLQPLEIQAEDGAITLRLRPAAGKKRP